MNIKHIVKIGENAHGYEFKVGLLGERWVGYADSSVGSFFFPGVGEEHMMGVKDKNDAIKLTLIVALTPEHGYGGVDTYFVDEALRPTEDEVLSFVMNSDDDDYDVD